MNFQKLFKNNKFQVKITYKQETILIEYFQHNKKITKAIFYNKFRNIVRSRGLSLKDVNDFLYAKVTYQLEKLNLVSAYAEQQDLEMIAKNLQYKSIIDLYKKN